MDVFSTDKRSAIMAAVRSSGNKRTEVRLVAILREQHITGWRRSYKLFGKPDFVFPRGRLAVFVDGCFWHSCPIHGTVPKTNTDFWLKKLAQNVERDRAVSEQLRSRGWSVLRLWQHDLKHATQVADVIRQQLHSLP